MNSRSSWLNHTREYLKQDISGRKYFKIHKNLHNIELSPKSSTPVNLRKQNSPVNVERDSLRLEKFTRPDRLTPDVDRMIRQKDSEIRNLRKLYHEASSRVKNLENHRNVEPFIPSPPSGTLKKLLWSDAKVIGRPVLESPSLFPRTKSTQNYGTPKVQDFSFTKQMRFTKNKPKLVFSNPITGVPIHF